MLRDLQSVGLLRPLPLWLYSKNRQPVEAIHVPPHTELPVLVELRYLLRV